MKSNEIIMASSNKGKIKEAQEILKEYKVISMKEFGIEIDVEEDKNTFEGNAIKKAEIIAKELNGKMFIEKLKNVPKDKRKIKFITALAISDGTNTISSVEYIEGYVSENVRGENGFGFDEIFELNNGKTLAELSQEEKNELSARRKALETLKIKLLQYTAKKC